MKNIVISSILALAVVAFSGCATKSAPKGISCAKPIVLPSCVTTTPCAPVKKFVPCPTGC